MPLDPVLLDLLEGCAVPWVLPSQTLGILGKVVGMFAERVFPDPVQELKRLELQQALHAAVLERTSEIEKAAADVVKAEAQGQSWL